MFVGFFVVPPAYYFGKKLCFLLSINFDSVLFQNKSPSKLDGLIVVATLWYLQESNQGHTDFQSVALPTELRYQALLSGCKYNFKIRIYKQNPEKKVLIFFNCRPL